jgi:hypothetical protein
MLTFIFYVLIRLFTFNAADWSSLSEFRIYQGIQISDFSNLTEKEIEGMKYRKLNTEKAIKLLSRSARINKPITWKGMGYLAIVKFKDGSSRRLLINTFGGTFRDGTGNANYRVDETLQREWYKFLLPAE